MMLRRRPSFRRRVLVPALLVVLLAPTFRVSASSGSLGPRLTPRQGPGNQLTMGSRESGLFMEYTLTGADLGDRQGDGSVTGTLTSSTVTVNGTMYNSLGAGLCTRPSVDSSPRCTTPSTPTGSCAGYGNGIGR